ncbi:MAG: urea carboxylase-associated family protein [Hyphomicrobiales bacterium]|nr:urea carboxylase-associated family protein [Hyphomicrobiales bacterium]
MALPVPRQSGRPPVIRIEPRSGAAFSMKRGEHLTVTDILGEQVSDLIAYNAADPSEALSQGRTFDYLSRIFLTAGDQLYSTESRPMLTILEDTVGRHDFLLTPCNADTFRIIYADEAPHRGCEGNLRAALAEQGLAVGRIPTCFNVFMNVRVDGETGAIAVAPPLSRAGDRITFRADMDLIVGLTACSALQSNNFAFKPIGYEITGG